MTHKPDIANLIFGATILFLVTTYLFIELLPYIIR